MKLIKLDAIDSTNEFLKRILNDQFVENYTVITAENQTKGKGQMGAVWESEIGKNLIMSVLIKDFLDDISQIFNLHYSFTNSYTGVAGVQNIQSEYKMAKRHYVRYQKNWWDIN